MAGITKHSGFVVVKSRLVFENMADNQFLIVTFQCTMYPSVNTIAEIRLGNMTHTYIIYIYYIVYGVIGLYLVTCL